jgi:hypothetical protein
MNVSTMIILSDAHKISSANFHYSRVQRSSAVGSALTCCTAGRVRFSARHPMGVPPTEPTAVKKWRWAKSIVYELMSDE